MAKKTVEERVVKIIARYLHISESEILMGSTLEEDLGTDSLDQILE